MFLTIHSTSGIVIGQAIANPIGAFLAGLLSHLVLDIIPHGDENFSKDGRVSIKFLAKLAALDILAMMINLYFIFYVFSFELFSLPVILAITGAILPDFNMGLFRLTENKNLKFFKILNKTVKPFEALHHYCHFYIIPYEVSIAAGAVIQIVTLVLLWVLLASA